MTKPERFCADPTCTEDVYADGFCQTHWASELPGRPAPRCIKTGCDRDRHARDLCGPHWDEMKADIRRRREVARMTPKSPEPAGGQDEPEPLRPLFADCPNDLIPLVAACADNDAKAIIRVIWPHFLEAHLAGLEPFTLEQVS